ncbi:AGC family protein kinase [Tritrichomonas foetus]|uniref:AGC family protein kinase n=1 Tax=Tritrichomonas foetus TaxID=1144522 RepID=A0A1J4L4F5_9EUKA|nr:AGC family protein kinase [Tritrichomonas foetus]|eukprot:OHT16813.1 AGC family protein kinase [Tritrichomonas foetus]
MKSNKFLKNSPTLQEEKIDLIKKTLQQHEYIYKSPVGKGGFASVHLVTSERYNVDFAVKISEKPKGEKGEVNDAEISNLIQLSHPNIISMYEYFTDSVFLYIILEYCPGGSLCDLVKKTGPLRGKVLAHCCKEILLALKHCHDRNIAHRDLKPANVLIDRNNRCKLADFGLSDDLSLKHSMTWGGTRPYMAPELIIRSKYDLLKADIWALAVTFYQLASGNYPWNISNPKEMNLAISMRIVSYNSIESHSKDLVFLLKSMFEVTPANRPSVDDLLQMPYFQDILSESRLQLGKSTSVGSSLNLLFKTGSMRKGTSEIYRKNHGTIIEDDIGDAGGAGNADVKQNGDLQGKKKKKIEPIKSVLSFQALGPAIAIRRTPSRMNLMAPKLMVNPTFG